MTHKRRNDVNDVRQSLKQRSWPGRGAPVVLWVGEHGGTGDMLEDPDGDAVIGTEEAEDFSNCGWDVCVKVKVGADKTDAARLLRKIADAVAENGDRHMREAENSLTL